eukprot:101348-Pleurochrysis_carterae.AAC.1
MRTHRYGIYMPSSHAARLVSAALEYVRGVWPFWNASGGRDHIFTFTGDNGAVWMRARLPLLTEAVFITHWGDRCLPPNDCVRLAGWRAHWHKHDIVVPPLWRPRLLSASPWLSHEGTRAVLRAEKTFAYLLYFVGKVHRSAREGDSYSYGVRQRLFALHANRSDFYLRARANAVEAEATAAEAKFCLAPHGTGFGMRQYDAIALGCVPLIIRIPRAEDVQFGGFIEQPFEEVLDWREFALFVNRSELPSLPSILASVS